ncbi:MAG: Cytosine deaminase related metal-dependent hydrolase [Candidatus Methanohalarchaeum thermophilum]|uniref:Cytosine deaminase related metal-dependent hydrolase n=1 Tax=Methanohalarchaeum thermophilum TaxID=1903181 RepID=A0A1Q6DTK4_METT1|nr:MAG: Cytosine deaminase related metal-dependent hydrolase [Candidatus Methanohalarchaeum thermophilum]
MEITIEGKIYQGDLTPIKGFIRIKDGIIKEFSSNKLNKDPDYQGTVFPSFVNAHTHLGDSIFDVDPKKYSLEELVGPGGYKERKLESTSHKEKEAGIIEALQKGLRQGVTDFCDFREEGIKGAKLLKRASSKCKATVKILGRPREVTEKRVLNLLDYTDGLGISSVNDYPKKDLNIFKKFSKKRDIDLALHAAETDKGQDKSIRETNKTEVERAISLSPYHIVHATNPRKSDLEKIENNNIPVVICPRSNKITEVGLPPYLEMIERDIQVGIGTDNAMLCDTSILNEIKFLYEEIKEKSEAPVDLPKKLIRSSTLDGARIIGKDNEIKEGNIPSMILIEEKNFSPKSLLKNKDPIDIVFKGSEVISNV